MQPEEEVTPIRVETTARIDWKTNHTVIIVYVWSGNEAISTQTVLLDRAHWSDLASEAFTAGLVKLLHDCYAV